MAKWTKQKRVGRGFEYSRLGLNGRSSQSGNAHIVEVHWNYNGSGPQAFGGAREWPVVSAHVSFVEGEEQRAEEFGAALRDFIDNYLNQPATNERHVTGDGGSDGPAPIRHMRYS